MSLDEPTLTEFLLARIHDREAVAHDIQHTERPGVVPMVQVFGGGALIREMVDPAHILAECAAKRRIVNPVWWSEAGGQVLELLALPYADHPDYRAEWKP